MADRKSTSLRHAFSSTFILQPGHRCPRSGLRSVISKVAQNHPTGPTTSRTILCSKCLTGIFVHFCEDHADAGHSSDYGGIPWVADMYGVFP
jgi:hypothetical protein